MKKSAGGGGKQPIDTHMGKGRPTKRPGGRK